MGIPKLMKDLAPYTERAILGKHFDVEVAVNISALVIDGPSFVHEAYRRQMRSVSDLSYPLAYRDINEAVVHLLDEIQNHGVEIKKIYFDGALPVPKRATRLERLEKHRQELEMFTKAQSRKTPIKESPQPPVRGKTLLQGLANSSLHAPKALEPPFLVASAIEHLKQSTYCPVVELIPDEAEAGCIVYARDHDRDQPSLAMFSSDTDLVVYPEATLKQMTLVLLRTLEEVESEPGKSILVADCLRPSQISLQLKIPGLHVLAYHRYHDPTASSSAIKRAAKTTQPQEDMYFDFLAEYDLLEAAEERFFAQRCCHLLDPRLSELRSQYQNSRHMLNDLDPMHMYLPALFEDPSRESPWAHGEDLRQMAYSLLNIFEPTQLRRSSLVEYQRRGRRIGGRVVDLLSKDDLLKVFGEDTDLLQHIHIGESRVATVKSWQKVALKAVNKRRAEDGRFTFLPAIHLSACIQAVLYSLRLLKQVTDLLNNTAPRSQVVPQELLDKLTTMPSLADVMDATPEICDPT